MASHAPSKSPGGHGGGGGGGVVRSIIEFFAVAVIGITTGIVGKGGGH